MSSIKFTVTEHMSPCSYIRQYPHSAKRDEAVLQLAVKEYRPIKKGVSSAQNAVTIIAAHGNGFPKVYDTNLADGLSNKSKELFEPLWDDLFDALSEVKIDSIWVADMQHQGASYALNAKELGDDPGWFDHSLDLLLMINRFRDKMKAPLIGVGHSMGCAQVAYLASIHPRLFHSVVFIDPVMQVRYPDGPNAAMFSSMRREKWDSRAKAEAQISKNPFFRAMDPRSLKLFLAYALTDTPDGGVKLTTPKAQEAWSFLRSNFFSMSEDTKEGRHKERMLNPDMEIFSYWSKSRMNRPEVFVIWEMLPQLRPRTIYVYGENSHIHTPEGREEQVAQTGSGRGGNGGVKDGGVVQKVIGDCSHMCVFEKPSEIAKVVSGWLEPEVIRWKHEKEFWDTVDTGKSKNGRTELSDKWIAAVKEDRAVQRPNPDKTSKL